MADRKSATRTVYHIVDGPKDMYHVDAAHALQFKKEWREKPWSEKQKAAALAKQEIEDDEQESGEATE